MHWNSKQKQYCEVKALFFFPMYDSAIAAIEIDMGFKRSHYLWFTWCCNVWIQCLQEFIQRCYLRFLKDCLTFGLCYLGAAISYVNDTLTTFIICLIQLPLSIPMSLKAANFPLCNFLAWDFHELNLPGVCWSKMPLEIFCCCICCYIILKRLKSIYMVVSHYICFLFAFIEALVASWCHVENCINGMEGFFRKSNCIRWNHLFIDWNICWGCVTSQLMNICYVWKALYYSLERW